MPLPTFYSLRSSYNNNVFFFQVVISCCHNSAPNESNTGTANCGAGGACAGVVKLCRALLAAGAHCVLLSLWPVPDTASKILLRAFYSALLQGNRAAR